MSTLLYLKPHRVARTGSDYTLQYYKKTVMPDPGGVGLLVSYAWESVDTALIPYTTTGTVTRFHYTLEIPIGDEAVKVRLLPKFDWEDEGVLFDPTTPGTPWDDIGENAWLVITAATWYTKPSSYDAIDHFQQTDKVEIKDGALCLVMTDSNNDGVINMDDRIPGIKNPVNAPGRVLRVNTDDDDKNGVLDKWQRPDQFNVPMNAAALAGTAPSVTVQNEDDLAKAILYAWIDPDGIEFHTIDVYSIFPNDLVMWTESTKGSRLHRGEIVNGQVTSDTKLATLKSGTNNNLFTRTVYMEANAQVVGNVELHAKFTNGCNPAHPNGYDSAKMTGIIVDLDIDSDNTYPGINGQPSRSDEEEWLEMYEYATGKIMKPNWGTSTNGILDCWNGFSNGGANNPVHLASPDFYPIVLQIPEYIPLADISIQISYAMASLTPTNGLNAPPALGDGTIRIWKKDGSFARNGLVVTAGGDFVMATLSNSYTPQQLGFSSSVRTISLYVEAVTENAQTTRVLAELLGKPETTIKFSVNIANVGTFEDEVRYVVSNVGSFYYELMTHPELMATYMSEAIYGRDDKPEFAFKAQSNDELEGLGLRPEIREMLIDYYYKDGFNAALYREYITGKYVLTFEGTDPTSFDDWRTNFAQAFSPGGVAQYEYANEIGEALATNKNFNAAGLHPDTVYNSPNMAYANSLITSYKVDYDILSWGQWIGSWLNYVFGTTVIPVALGTPVTIDSQYDTTVMLNGITTVASLVFQLYPVTGLSGFAVVLAGIECHKMPQVIYGMEKVFFKSMIC